MGTQRSSWITGVVLLQLLYVLVLLALPAYLLVLTRMPETRNGHDPAGNIYGLKIAAAVLGIPALVALTAWFGLWKGRRWGWGLTVLADVAFVGAFIYSIVDDGWRNLDWAVVVLTLIAAVPVVYLLLPQVRKFYWSAQIPVPPATCIGSSLRSE
jgi:hypothetical protein